ncbi:MAG: carbohydrate binding family 9 domain-containing protein [Gemmatimonadetes bacterium]|nr:carbohydrate binding family 9 domain-containing protein [Gemmatimonadota bacterium]
MYAVRLAVRYRRVRPGDAKKRNHSGRFPVLDAARESMIGEDPLKAGGYTLFLNRLHRWTIMLSALIILGPVDSEARQPAPEKRVYNTRHITSLPPDIDGRGNDAAWGDVEWSGDFTQLDPDDGGEPTQQTAFKILFDDHNLYVLIRAFDTEPDQITHRVTRRDDFDKDWVEIHFDSYHDKRTAFSFTLSSSGGRGDEAISNDGNDWDPSWDPVWYGASTIDEEGWLAEMRIPLSQLRFSGEEGQVWGLQVQRRLYRRQERSGWQHIQRNSPGWVSLFGELRGLEGIESSHRIEILPYVVGDLNRFQAEAQNPFRDGQRADGRIGLDGKIGLAGNITMDLAVNPDFGQVEADPSRVNLSAFELFFEERRPLFVEGKNITEFQVGGGGPFRNDQLFYSRRIGRSPQRHPDLSDGQTMDMPRNTPILAAAKITGKTPDGLSIGIVDAVTAETAARIDTKGARSEESVEPLTNYLVARLQQDFNDGGSSLGTMLTATNRNNNRDHFDFLNRAAYTGGIDFRHQWSDRTYWLNASLSFSHVRGEPEAMTRVQRNSARYYQRPDADYVALDSTLTALSGHGGSLGIGRSGNSPWNMGTSGTWRSPGLELNDVGFLRLADVFMQNSWIGYRSEKPNRIFREYNVFINQWQGFNFGRERKFFGGNINGGGQFNNYWWVWFNMMSEITGLSTTALRGGPALKTPGNVEFNFDVDTDGRKPLSFGFGGGHNRFRDDAGRGSWVYVSMQYRPSNAMNIRINPFFNTNRNELQYVTHELFGDAAQEDRTDRYLLGRVDQKTLGIEIRLNYSITNNMSIQYYGQPFVSAGHYDRFKRITDPRADRFGDRFAMLSDDQLTYDDSEEDYRVDEDLDGRTDYTFGDPDFNFRQFRSNLVLRWEYTPGSTLFLVWQQQRSRSGGTGEFAAGQDLNDLFDTYPSNIFLLKFNYWFSL